MTFQPFGLEALADRLDVAAVVLVLVAEDDDRRLLGERPRAHRVHVGEDAGEVLRAVQLEVALGIERRQVDPDVAEAAHRLEPRGAVGVEVRGVGQDRDGQAAVEEDPAALLEERIHRGLVVVRQEDDDPLAAGRDDLVHERHEELLAHDLLVARVHRDGAERAAMVAARAGLERDVEQVRAARLGLDVVDQEARGPQVLEDRRSPRPAPGPPRCAESAA